MRPRDRSRDNYTGICADCKIPIVRGATRCASCATKNYHRSLTAEQRVKLCESMTKTARTAARGPVAEIKSMMQDYNEQEYTGFGEIEAAKKRGDAMRMELDLRAVATLL